MNLMKDILDDLSESIIILDPDGKIVMFNNEAVRINRKISRVPLCEGNYFVNSLNEERGRIVAKNLSVLRRDKTVVRNFAEYPAVDGSVFLEIIFSPLFSNNNEILYVKVVAQDVTISRAHERKLSKANDDVRHVFESAHALIFSIDSRGYVMEWNEHCEKVTGFAKKDVLQEKVIEKLLPEDAREPFSELIEAVQGGMPVENTHIVLKHKEGRDVFAIMSATRRTNSKGQPVGVIFVGQDISELVQYRRSLEDLIRKEDDLRRFLKKQKDAIDIKSRFVSIASHEFRTPLSSIDYATNFIKQHAGSIGKRKLNEKVRVIEKHVQNMNHLLEDVLRYSQHEEKGIRVIPARIDLDQFAGSLRDEIASSCRNSHAIITHCETSGWIYTDEKLLRNILTNLLTNAIKFSPGRDEVWLNITSSESVISFEVKDSGIGIQEDEIETIFNPFTRGKAVGEIPGNGLGLSIVKKAVDALGGVVEVKSRKGYGSIFKVTIPRQSFFS